MSDKTEIQRMIMLGHELVQQENLVAQLEYELQQAKKHLEVLSQDTLPQAMLDLNMQEFRLTTGEKIKVKPVLIVQLPKPNVDRAEVWLNQNGHDGLMKHTIEIALPRTTGQNSIQELYGHLDDLGVDYQDKKTIHYQTLNKWAREMDEQGEVIPTEIFSVYRTMKSEVTK